MVDCLPVAWAGSSGCSNVADLAERVELHEDDRLRGLGVDDVEPKDFPERGEEGTRVSSDPALSACPWCE